MDFKLVFHHVALGYYLGIIMCVNNPVFSSIGENENAKQFLQN